MIRQSEQEWRAKVIDKLAHDLRTAFPEMKGFSSRNLKYMRAFVEAWPDEQIMQQLVAQNAVGTTVVSGVLTATFFGVYLTPVFFVVITRIFGKK